jgi:hypothetical protein
MKLAVHTEKNARPRLRNNAYVNAFASLDAALAENTRARSNDLEKIDRLRLAVFGCVAGMEDRKSNYGA